jgi:riboflavin synthase
MFTGIVAAVGRLMAREVRNGDLRLRIGSGTLAMDDVALGDSIAVSGVCLTVVDRDASSFCADVSTETLALTSLGQRVVGNGLNLEKSLRLADRLGGHLVSGHVDATAAVLSVHDDARAQRWRFALPKSIARFVAVKGSITVDGVSLTVNAVDAESFSVALIPHTIAATTFGERGVGTLVNLEVDLLARYLDRMLAARDEATR